MKIGTLKIEISEKVKDIIQYLNTTDRIILSAKFGDGKTYLLNALRDNTAAKEKYEFFTIYPVNYSVAPNEDVFEYIKRDIIVQLHDRNLLNKIDLEAIFSSLFNFNDLASVVSFLLSFIPGGTFYNKILNQFFEIRRRYEQKKHTADKYLSIFANQKGSIYEEDGYTKLVREAITWMSSDHKVNGRDHKGKKPVLIIEDLDRLDPNHLFRILNVISAHIDDCKRPDKVGNKFGFHNIILVMDYDTTKHIFHHFYGNQACYEGYMSKFLSREPFRYSIRREMVKLIEEKLTTALKLPNLFSAFPKFKQKLSQSSIRELNKFAQLETNNFIKSAKHTITQPDSDGSKFSLSTSFKLFQLIIYMIEIGMTQQQIKEDFISAGRTALRENYNFREEYLKLMFPIYATRYSPYGYFNIGNLLFRFRQGDISEDPTDIDIDEMASGYTSNGLSKLQIDEMANMLFESLNEFSKSINFSALQLDNDLL